MDSHRFVGIHKGFMRVWQWIHESLATDSQEFGNGFMRIHRESQGIHESLAMDSQKFTGIHKRFTRI